MSEDVAALLVKGLRRLPQKDQDEVLRQLLSERMELQPVAAPGSGNLSLGMAGMVSGPGVREHPLLGEMLAAESGGPWQTVPVRLPVEVHERLKRWCQRNNFTMAVVIRGLVSRFLDERGALPEETHSA